MQTVTDQKFRNRMEVFGHFSQLMEPYRKALKQLEEDRNNALRELEADCINNQHHGLYHQNQCICPRCGKVLIT